MHRRFALWHAPPAKPGQRRVLRYLAGLLLLALLAAGGLPAAAQEPSPFTVTVDAGYDGAYRVSEWFPVHVEIANSGPDVQGELEWNFPGQRDEEVFRTQIDLPRGARKRVTLEVFSQEFARNGQLRLLSGGRELLRQNVNLEAIDRGDFIIGIVSSDAGLLNSLSTMQLQPGAVHVQHIDPGALPFGAPALRSLNALVLHDIDSAALTPEQRAALHLWVALGGQLIVSGGPNASRTSAGLADLLPVEPTGAVEQGSLAALSRMAPISESPPEDGALSAVQARQGATSLPSQSDALLWAWQFGEGYVTFSAFDLAALRGWDGEANMVRRLLNTNNFFAPGLVSRQQRINLLEDVLRLPELNIPSTLTLLAFLLVYIVVVGPINYLVLRHMRRLEWAWLTLPVTVLVFATFFYMVGFGIRGGSAQVNQIAIVQGTEGQADGLATAYTGIFSPRRTAYTLDFPADTLVHEARSWTGNESETIPVLNTGSSVVLRDVLVDVGSVRTFLAETQVEVPLGVSSSVEVRGGNVRGQVHNTSDLSIQDALVVYDGTFFALGDLEAGETASFNFNANADNFPWGVGNASSEHFNRQQLLIRLFTGDLGSSLSNRQTYLLAWANNAPLPVTVNNQNLPINGDTLYIIHLNEGSPSQSAQTP